MAKPNKTALLAARCTRKQKKRITDAIRSTGLDETAFLLTAVTEFFANHDTPEKQIAAVSNYRVKQAAA